MQNSAKKDKFKIYLFVLLIMSLVTAVFLNSFHWLTDEISTRKILVAFISIFFVLVVPIITIKIEYLFRIANCFLKRIIDIAKTCWAQRKTIIIHMITLLILTSLCIAGTYIVSKYLLQTSYNIYLFYTLITGAIITWYIVKRWKVSSKSPEKIFFVLVLALGIFCIGVTPNRVGISWDDQIHYDRTLEISNFLNGIMYAVDDDHICQTPYYGRLGYDQESNQEFCEKMESLYSSKAGRVHDFSKYGTWTVALIPSAIGIFLARGLGLSYFNIFNMGRLFNLIAYAILIYHAMKRLKYGKVLVAVIGMIPVTIFMGASYSCDPWVIGCTILGFAYFVAELQDDKPLENKNIIIMISAIVLGCIPKAIYFPILLPLLFMPKHKFRSDKQRKWYYFAVVGAATFLVCTFMLPLLIKGAGEGDIRGGEGVNSAQQIKYILQNPFAYTKTLLEFLLKYVSFENTSKMLSFFAYIGAGFHYHTICILLIVVAFLDHGPKEKNGAWIRSAGVLGCFAAIVLAATAMYVSFTAVASESIAGMQSRYMLPIIYPMLFCIGAGGTKHKINKNAFVCVPMLIISFLFIYSMFILCVLPY